MNAQIITISREFGSGGRSIGKQVAELLSIPCYDGALLDKIAERSGFPKTYIEELCEDAASENWIAAFLSGIEYSGHTVQNDLHAIQRQTILELAEQGPCVIVGRCADHILKDRTDCLHAFIYADLPHRIRRIVEEYGDQSESPEKRIREMDKRRAAYYQLYTDTRWKEIHNYHVMLDSGTLGLDACAALLASLYRAPRES
jgi:cytidylate kinase